MNIYYTFIIPCSIGTTTETEQDVSLKSSKSEFGDNEQGEDTKTLQEKIIDLGICMGQELLNTCKLMMMSCLVTATPWSCMMKMPCNQGLGTMGCVGNALGYNSTGELGKVQSPGLKNKTVKNFSGLSQANFDPTKMNMLTMAKNIGSRLWVFVTCTGKDWFDKCKDHVLSCFGDPIPIACVVGMDCNDEVQVRQCYDTALSSNPSTFTGTLPGSSKKGEVDYLSMVIKYGKNVQAYLICIGKEWIKFCQNFIMKCAFSQSPWNCFTTIPCAKDINFSGCVDNALLIKHSAWLPKSWLTTTTTAPPTTSMFEEWGDEEKSMVLNTVAILPEEITPPNEEEEEQTEVDWRGNIVTKAPKTAKVAKKSKSIKATPTNARSKKNLKKGKGSFKTTPERATAPISRSRKTTKVAKSVQIRKAPTKSRKLPRWSMSEFFKIN